MREWILNWFCSRCRHFSTTWIPKDLTKRKRGGYSAFCSHCGRKSNIKRSLIDRLNEEEERRDSLW